MRQIVSTILLIIYSVCSTGATIHLHHCGKNTDISLSQNAKSLHNQCPHCQENHAETIMQHATCSDGNSCQDIQVELKNDYDQLQSKSSLDFSHQLYPVYNILHWITRNFFVPSTIEHLSENNHFTYRIYDEPFYLKHCVFII